MAAADGAPAAPAAEPLRVGVAYSPAPGVVDEVELSMPPGATVRDAIRASGVQARHPALDLERVTLGVWGAARQPEERLRDRDRVELYRPLTADPMEARRRRQAAQARRPKAAVKRR